MTSHPRVPQRSSRAVPPGLSAGRAREQQRACDAHTHVHAHVGDLRLHQPTAFQDRIAGGA